MNPDLNPEVLFQLAERVKFLREVRDELEAKAKDARADLDRAERDLADLMVDCEMKNFTKSGTMFSLVTKVRASAASGRKDDLFAALKEHGYGDLVCETVNANSLAAFAREQMEENGDALPGWLDGLVSTFEQSSISLRKST